MQASYRHRKGQNHTWYYASRSFNKPEVKNLEAAKHDDKCPPGTGSR